jgi:hypothetical protein
VVTVNVAVALPAGMVKAGADAYVLLLDSDTASPPVGALPVRVTVPVEVMPAWTTLGDSVRPDRAGGLTVTVAVSLTPDEVAVIVGVAAVETGSVVTVKLAVALLAATVTDAGTVAALVLLLDRLTTRPPAGAVVVSVTVP